MEDCPHSLIHEAELQLSGLAELFRLIDDDPVEYITGFQVSMLLEPVDKKLKAALKALEDAPIKRRRSIA